MLTASVIVPFLYSHVIAFFRPSSENLVADVPDTCTGLDVNYLAVDIIISHTIRFTV